VSHPYRVVLDNVHAGWFSNETAAVDTAHYLRHIDPQTDNGRGNRLEVRILLHGVLFMNADQVDEAWSNRKSRRERTRIIEPNLAAASLSAYRPAYIQ
jgi:hypothetical protein